MVAPDAPTGARAPEALYLYYRDPREVAATVERQGFVQHRHLAGHSFTLLAFTRASTPAPRGTPAGLLGSA